MHIIDCSLTNVCIKLSAKSVHKLEGKEEVMNWNVPFSSSFVKKPWTVSQSYFEARSKRNTSCLGRCLVCPEETEKAVALTSEATVKGQDSFTKTSDWAEGSIFKGYCTFSIDYFSCMLCLDSWNIQLISSHEDLWLRQLIQWLQHLYFVTEKLRCLERKQRINWLGFLVWWTYSFCWI